ncbi:MAG TPA: helix-turn-helix domain-containing protein [Nitrospiraceae bacterium]|nr:helix-turn-helix domain-containing protein [Nitrospiraceae bacterium]
MLMTVNALAQHLQIKPATLYAWAAQGRIPCLKIHGLLRFRKDDIDHWLESCRKPVKDRPVHRMRVTGFDLSRVIARARRDAYNPRHGETRPIASPTGKEGDDGAR